MLSIFFMEWQILSFPVLLAFLLFIIVILRIKKKVQSNNLTPNLPPGPWKFPIIGNFHQVVSTVPHQRLRDLAKKYGPIMQLQLGEVSTFVISVPEAAKEVLKIHEINFAERPPLLIGSLAFYNRKDILFAPYGDYWRWLRKLSMLELLSAKRVQSFRSIREEKVTLFIRSISSNAGFPINLSEMFYSLANGIMVRICIGKKGKNQEAFLPIIKEVLKAGAGLNMVDLFPSAKLFHIFSWTKFKIKRAHLEADKMLEDIINERRGSRTKTVDKDVEGILDFFLNLHDGGNAEFPITNENIKATILDMFLAGSDTTPIILEWALSEMIRNPKVMTKAQREVREVFSHKGTVDESGLREVKYVKLIIKETLRLHPPVTLLPRECTQSCKIHGYDIQEKSKAMINLWAIGRDPDYWIEAEKFYPERFLSCSSDYNGTDFEFIPFGAGRRMCPGLLLGITTAELILTHLLYHFDWELPSGVKNEDLDMTEAFSSVVGRKHDLIVIPMPFRPSTIG